VLTDHQAVEFFHLQFVRLLCAGPDKDRFAIKGGCNLRFFFESVRYSEDIDLDVARMPVHTLKEKVGKILGAPALALPLRSRGISVSDVTSPKQTETTQRWKVGLSVEGRSLALHTKIEFSRRGTTEDAVIEPVAASLLAEYRLMPLLAPHYPLAAALRQKVGALVGRGTVQARDVFDLAVLLARAGGRVDALHPIRAQIPRAIERAMDVSYGDFKSQVASYLKPEELDEYGTREAWDAMQAQVVEGLEKAAA
jgi:Nucleotidyl transferase AbiEii toxin, Type IV TA system